MLPIMSIIQDFIESLNIQGGSRYRSDCPVCGHRNSFSAFNDGMNIIFKCFHADCTVKGRVRVRLCADPPPLRTRNRYEHADKPLNSFELPDTFVDVSRSDDAMRYLKQVNVMDSYLHRTVRMMYDQRLNRAVFLIRNGAKTVDAVGRTLSGAAPKWYRYGNSKQLFTAGDAPTAVLVEDCASAACVSHLVTGVAMLGTSLLKEHIVQLKKFDTVYVALDKDATKLGLKTVQTLKPHLDVRMLILEEDLKNMEKGKRDEFIRAKTAGAADTAVLATP